MSQPSGHAPASFQGEVGTQLLTTPCSLGACLTPAVRCDHVSHHRHRCCTASPPSSPQPSAHGASGPSSRQKCRCAAPANAAGPVPTLLPHAALVFDPADFCLAAVPHRAGCSHTFVHHVRHLAAPCHPVHAVPHAVRAVRKHPQRVKKV